MPTIASPPRAKDEVYQDRMDIVVPFAAFSASGHVKFATADRDYEITGVEIIDPTGLALNITNFFVCTLKGGATTRATLTTHDTAITADTPVALALVAAAVRGAAGEVLSMDFALTGTQTLPAGLARVRGYWRS